MFVLDASVALASVLEQPEAAIAEPVIRRMAEEVVHVPFHWALELTNVLAREVRRNLIGEARATGLAREVASWPLTVDDRTFVGAFSEIFELALAHRLTAYDAAYLELCLRLGAPLATFDVRLADAARSQGVPLIL